MSRVLSILRGLGGLDDRARAYEAERSAVAAASSNPPVDPRFQAEMATLSRRPDQSIAIGNACADSSIQVRIPVRDIAGTGHGLVVGGTGSGKTRLVAGIARAILGLIAERRVPIGLMLVDHKSEFTELMRLLFLDLLTTLPVRDADRMLDSLVVVNPFSTSALVPMQILKPEPGVPAEVQAFEVTSLVDRLGGADLGVRQDSFLFHLTLLGITRGMSLPEVAGLTSDPMSLASAAIESSSPEVRDFFSARSGTQRLAAGSLEGVRARLHRLLRLPSTKLMLGARDALSFRRLLSEKIVFVDVGSPPLGCEDLGRFWAGLVMLKLTRAIFERTADEARRPVVVLTDEWQEGLSGGGDMAEHYERVLSMARSRGVSFWLISQSLAGAARVSASLPKVAATNASVQFLFRSSIEDARSMAHLLPVTGRRLRPEPAPWERRTGSPYLAPDDEARWLMNEVTTLPDRTFYLWNRKRPYRAELVRALDVEPRKGQIDDAYIARRLRDGSLAVPIADLQRQASGADDFRALPPARPAGLLAAPTTRPRFGR